MTGLGDIQTAPRRPLTRSSALSPAALLVEARRADPDVTLDELTAARLCASEHGSGTAEELCCIIDAELNRADMRGRALTAHLTDRAGFYGPQDRSRPASTARNPSLRHLAAARAVLGGELRGIARGATRFFDPRTQDRLHQAFRAGRSTHIHSCSALGLLTAWCYDRPGCSDGRRCCGDGSPPPTKGNGPDPERWVGPIRNVDAYRLMLMAPSSYGLEHDRLFAEARAVIVQKHGLPSLLENEGIVMLLLLGLKVAVLS